MVQLWDPTAILRKHEIDNVTFLQEVAVQVRVLIVGSIQTCKIKTRSRVCFFWWYVFPTAFGEGLVSFGDQSQSAPFFAQVTKNSVGTTLGKQIEILLRHLSKTCLKYIGWKTPLANSLHLTHPLSSDGS